MTAASRPKLALDPSVGGIPVETQGLPLAQPRMRSGSEPQPHKRFLGRDGPSLPNPPRSAAVLRAQTWLQELEAYGN